MKFCNTCKNNKPVSEFHKNIKKKDGLQTICKSCRKEYHHWHYIKNKDLYVSNKNKRREGNIENYTRYKKSLKCERCNEDRWYVLEFHHKDSIQKEGNIASMIRKGRNIDRVIKEIRKCEVLCANCHREFHFLEDNK